MAEAWKTVRPYSSRAYTCALLELLDEGMLDKSVIIEELLRWMSEDDVEQFCKKTLRDEDNECLIREEEECEE